MADKLQYRITGNFAEGGMALLRNIMLSDGSRALLRELRQKHFWRLKVRRRFIQGVRIRAEITPHPNLVNSLELGNRLFRPYEIIEYIPADNLKSLMNNRSEALRFHGEDILREAARGLAEVHRHNFLHLDVKPENFLVDTRDRLNPAVKLTDFDLACTPEQAQKTRPMGTPAYMAPEQINTKVSLKASDVFAFGTMAYLVLSGRFPFSGNSEAQTMRNQADEKVLPRPLSEFSLPISTKMERTIMRCLAKRVRERYSDMTAVLHALLS